MKHPQPCQFFVGQKVTRFDATDRPETCDVVIEVTNRTVALVDGSRWKLDGYRVGYDHRGMRPHIAAYQPQHSDLIRARVFARNLRLLKSHGLTLLKVRPTPPDVADAFDMINSACRLLRDALSR